ncbi:MAG: hypothetical protein GY765_12945, partial [bacterium]|nr:hypothetical protein [bacterium]
DADGNIELSRSFKGKKTSLEFQSDIAYLHHPDEDEQRFNPESMKVKFKLGNHSLTAGDLSIRNSKFTATSLARRGLRYQLKSKRLTLGTFFANSQQKEGFGGFGIPSTDAHIFGAEAAVRFGTNALARCIFMSGKDDMNSKTMVTDDEDFVYRVGNVFSIFGEWKLLKKKLQLKGEFAHSRFGSGESSEEAEKKDGSAWLLDADYKRGIFVFHTAYEKVSRSFSSIGNLFLPNDRQGVNTAVGVKKKAFSANLTYIDITTNIDNDVLPMLHTKEINSKFNWLIDKRFKVGGEFSLNNLDYDNNTGKQEGNKDMDTIRCSVVLGYIAGTNGITFKIGKTESKTFSSNFDGSINVFLKFGKVARLTSILSHQSNNNFTNQSTSKIYNAYLSGNVIFIPEYFSLTLTASGTRNNNSTGANTTVSLRGYLNFHMEQIFKEKIDSTLSLRCIHSSNKNESTDTDKKNTAFYMQLDFSF